MLNEEQITKLFGSGVGSVISGAFRKMDIAEEEISAAKMRHPKRADLIHSCFAFLCPSDVLMNCPDVVYRSHVRELLGRVGAGDYAVDLATKAECLYGFCELSLKAPVRPHVSALYHEFFAEVFPDAMDRIDVTREETETMKKFVSPEEIEELDDRMRNFLAQPERRKKLDELLAEHGDEEEASEPVQMQLFAAA